MKGLVQFIADLRNSRAQEAEAKRVNRIGKYSPKIQGS